MLMSPSRKSFEEWEAEQRARDPNWDRFVKAFQQVRGPKRKVPLLMDENLEADFVAEIQAVDYLRVSVGKAGVSDETVWQHARRIKAVLVTADLDFWDDHRFALQQSPGVIIVAGKSAEEKVDSLATAFGLWGIAENWRKVPNWLDGCKIKASRAGITGKHWDGNTTIAWSQKARTAKN
jgi:predicted nuclease of predicted toxin-antitoxin system